MAPSTITTRGQASEQRLAQEFPQHNWLERKLIESDGTLVKTPKESSETMQTMHMDVDAHVADPVDISKKEVGKDDAAAAAAGSFPESMNDDSKDVEKIEEESDEM